MNNMTFTTNKNTPFFDKNTTMVIKGIAVIMMLGHHFFTFPTWWEEGISYPFIESISSYICSPLKLCVSLFCFITGYFYFFNDNKTYKYAFKKITDLLISYWIIFFVFAFIACSFLEYRYSLLDFVAECFALKRPTMSFCWYVPFYIILMLLIPIIVKLLSRNIHMDIFVSFIIIPNIFRLIGHFINNDIISENFLFQKTWLPCFLAGYIFANYNLFEKIERLNVRIIINKKFNVLLMLIASICIPFGRLVMPELIIGFNGLPSLYINMDVVYAPLFIYTIIYLSRNLNARIINKTLSYIGKHSLLIWFVSCMFFNNCKRLFQPILYWPHNPILVTIWGLAICLLFSIIFDKIIVRIQKYKNRLLKL